MSKAADHRITPEVRLILQGVIDARLVSDAVVREHSRLRRINMHPLPKIVLVEPLLIAWWRKAA